MIQPKQRFQSFEEYLSYNDGTDKLYELFNGELTEIPPKPGLNFEIANFLFTALLPVVSYRRIRGYGLELEVRGEPRNRFPDLTVIQEKQVELLKQRNTIRLSMGPPVLVIEVVNSEEVQRSRNYVAKRMQYQDLGVSEYWIVDPQKTTIRVLELTNGVYAEAMTFSGEDVICSSQLGQLNLTSAEVFAATNAAYE